MFQQRPPLALRKCQVEVDPHDLEEVHHFTVGSHSSQTLRDGPVYFLDRNMGVLKALQGTTEALQHAEARSRPTITADKNAAARYGNACRRPCLPKVAAVSSLSARKRSEKITSQHVLLYSFEASQLLPCYSRWQHVGLLGVFVYATSRAVESGHSMMRVLIGFALH